MTHKDQARGDGYLDGLHAKPSKRTLYPPSARFGYDAGYRNGVAAREEALAKAHTVRVLGEWQSGDKALCVSTPGVDRSPSGYQRPIVGEYYTVREFVPSKEELGPWLRLNELNIAWGTQHFSRVPSDA